MNLVYGSVCSGIEAATVAWEPLGWSAKFFAEIDKFPSAVLAHHYGSNMPDEPLSKNGTPNYGDFTKIPADAGPVDVLVGGTPCQSFSVAGRRLGLDDPRGNLALEYLSLARRLRSRWIVWENVPGVLSSVSDEKEGDSGIRPGVGEAKAGDEWVEESDFATFLQFVQECGYGFAYRILDAQYVRVDGFGRAVPQRRRRVFVVGHLGDWRRAAAVLLEPAGMLRNSPPRRQPGQRSAPTISARTSGGGGLGTDFELDGGQTTVENAAFGGGNTSDEPRSGYAALTAKGQRLDFEVETFVVSGHGDYRRSDTPTLRASGGDVQGGSEGLVAHSLRGEGFDASEDGTGRGTPIVPVYAIQERAVSENTDSGPQGKGYQEDIAYTLEARNKTQGVAHAVPADAISIDMRNASRDPDKHDAVNRQGVGVGGDCAHTVSASHVNAVAFSMRGRDGGAMPEAEPDGVSPALRTDGGGSSKTFVAFSSKDYGADADSEVSPTLRAGGHDESHANAGVPPAIAVFDPNQVTSKTNRSSPQPGLCHTLPGTPNAPVAFDWYASESQSLPIDEGLSPPLKTTMQPAVAWSIMPQNSGKDYKAREVEVSQPIMAGGPVGGNQGSDYIQNSWAVRRLTPRECERLQGFPDDYTQIPNWDGWREVGSDEDIEELRAAGLTVKPGKNGFRVNDPDGVRYKALGNSMACNVMRWIGWRIDHFEKLVAEGRIPR